MDYKRLAEQVVTGVGGASNISTVKHCMTRLRFILNNMDNVDGEKVKNIPGVIGVAKSGGQYQVIIGTGVDKTYKEVVQVLGFNEDDSLDEMKEEKKQEGSQLNKLFKAFTGIIFPILGVMTAAGITKGILAALTTFELITTDSGTYQLLYSFADGFYYFLPIILGFSAATQLKSNPYVGATIGAALVYPSMVDLYNASTELTFLKLPVVLTSYASSVFPILVAVCLAAYLEKKIKPRIHDSITAFITPLIILMIVVPLTFLVIGPIMTSVSDIMASVTQSIYAFSPILTGIILGAFWQLIVIFGLHYAFIPILINNVTTMGSDPINAILNVTVFSLAGAAIGFGLKAKEKNKRALGISTGITGLMGITEPIIYGIALPYKRPFICAMIGGGIAGGFTAVMGGKMFSFGGNAVFAAPMFINPKGIDSNFTVYLIASSIAFFVPLILAYFFGIKEKTITSGKI